MSRSCRTAISPVASLVERLQTGDDPDHRRKWLKAHFGEPTEWTLGIPGIPSAIAARWLGSRWACWPDGVPTERRWSCVSSRLPRALDLETRWFRRLRRACEEAKDAGGLLVAVEGTAPERFVRRAAERWRLPLLDVAVAESPASDLARWFDLIATRLSSKSSRATGGSAARYSLWLSPPWEAASESAWSDVPARDRALVLLGDEVRALSVRPGGVVARLLDARRLAGVWPAGSVSVVADSPDADEFPAAEVTAPVETSRGNELPWPALLHCTRRHDGPWPGQSEEEFLDELICESPERDRSPLAALTRMLTEERLRASSAAIRGGAAMVCFTDAILAELPALRRFRPHRRRWDFEPFGLALRRDWLAERGARPVAYGDDELWAKLPADERPWFQRRRTRRGAAGESIDWSVEREWRCLGDLNLHDLPTDSAVVFVPDERSASLVARNSRWPVIVIVRQDSDPVAAPQR